jgi:hypothetical protein
MYPHILNLGTRWRLGPRAGLDAAAKKKILSFSHREVTDVKVH